MTTEQIDIIAHNYIVEVQGAIPAPLNYHGFPKIMLYFSQRRYLSWHPKRQATQKGDVVNVDITIIKDGYYGDTSKMFFAGPALPHAERLAQVTPRMPVPCH